MKAILCHEWGGPEGLRFEEVAPATWSDQARIRVRPAASILPTR